MSVRTVDLNADLGEGITDDAALLDIVTSANVACGYHAGSAAIMREVCQRAVEKGVSIGAHVSYLDRENFGRVPMDVPYAVLTQQVADQVGALSEAAQEAGIRVRYIKPHGALYHRALVDGEQAHAVLLGSLRWNLPVLTIRGVLAGQCVVLNREMFHEGFPDRGYDAEGRLIPRDLPGALLHDPDEIAAQALVLARSVRSLCVHGDSPGAVANARACRAALEHRGWRLFGL